MGLWDSSLCRITNTTHLRTRFHPSSGPLPRSSTFLWILKSNWILDPVYCFFKQSSCSRVILPHHFKSLRIVFDYLFETFLCLLFRTKKNKGLSRTGFTPNRNIHKNIHTTLVTGTRYSTSLEYYVERSSQEPPSHSPLPPVPFPTASPLQHPQSIVLDV